MSDTEYTAIRVKQSTKERAQKAKRPQETWDDFILRCSEEPTAVMAKSDIEAIIERKLEDRVVDKALK